MGPKTARYQAGQRVIRPATYWRRRFVALVLGFGVLSLVAWAFSGALAVGRTGSPPAAHASQDAAQHGGSAGQGGKGSGGSGGPSPSAQPSATSHERGAAGTGAAGAGGKPPVSPSPTATPPATASRHPCGSGAVVLSLFSGQAAYGPRHLPTFDVQVVTTSRRCTFNVGRKFLSLVITSGDARVWNSADCVSGGGSKVISLARGVPAVVPISWHRDTSAPGCTQAARRVPDGSYNAQASAGGLASKRLTFKIS